MISYDDKRISLNVLHQDMYVRRCAKSSIYPHSILEETVDHNALKLTGTTRLFYLL